MRGFTNRDDAGLRLGTTLAKRDIDRPVALGLPRGGVPVAHEVARVLRCPLDILIVRKLGAPGRPELALGAVGERDVRVLNHELIRRLGVTPEAIDTIEAREREEVERRARRYRGERNPIDIGGHTAIVIDDGVATGATARAGCMVARALGAKRVVLAVPVAPAGWSAEGAADDFVTLLSPRDLRAVGQWYLDFAQTTDEEVVQLLATDTPPT